MKPIFSWLRELGIVGLTLALFQTWFTSHRFNHAVTGIDLSTEDFQVFLYHFLVFLTYLISRFKPTVTWMWAIAFSTATPIFYAHILWWLWLGDRTSFAESLGIGGTTYDGNLDLGFGFLLSMIAMVTLAAGLFVSMNGNSRKKYIAGTIMGFIIVLLPTLTGFVLRPSVAFGSWLIGTVGGVLFGSSAKYK